MNNSAVDRIISIFTYYTLGFFGLIWLLFCHLTKKRIDSFLAFNIYQSIFLSVVFTVIVYLYSISLNLISVVPFIGKLAVKFDIFINQTPIYFSYTISTLVLFIILLYLSIFSLMGKKPYVPLISDVINSNFGR